MEAYKIKDFSFTYPKSDRCAVSNVELTIKKGEFILLCGESGCGKSTFLRCLKPTITPHGKHCGVIECDGGNIKELSAREQAEKIGFILQDVENQIVTDKVYHELAFGLESLGMSTGQIRLRVGEMASFFGIQDWFYHDVRTLSGGQKQILNLASVMAMRPEILILDEPTSQLDPIASSDFLEMLAKINRELGTTIILSEHRLEEALPICDRVLVMESGSIIVDEVPQLVGRVLHERNHRMFHAMPTPMRIYAQVDGAGEYPVTVRDGRMWLSKITTKQELKIQTPKVMPSLIQVKNTWFRYEKDGNDILKGLDMSIPKQSVYAVLGGNGTGKSTMLSVLSGINKPIRGSVKIEGVSLNKSPYRVCRLAQDVKTMFSKATVELDLHDVSDEIKTVSETMQITHLMSSHPYDLSGGEQQRVAIAKLLLLKPDILLLDEPTKGMDAQMKIIFAKILKQLVEDGKTVLMVSHDIEFCAKYADRCALFFDGSIISENDTHTFFADNHFYTTSASRMSRGILNGCVTEEEVAAQCENIRL